MKRDDEAVPRLAQDALGSWPGDNIAMTVTALAVLAFAAWVWVLLREAKVDEILVWVGAIGCAIGGVVVSAIPFVLLASKRWRREYARLAALPYAFGRDAYVASLDKTGLSGSLYVDVVFAAALPPAAHEAFERGARAAGIERVSWSRDGTEARLSSRVFTTGTMGADATAARRYDNGRIHRCLRRVLAGPVAAAQRTTPVTSVQASMQ